MSKMEPVSRVAEHIARMLHAEGEQRLPLLRRRVAGRDKGYFLDACALAIEKHWAERVGTDSLRPGVSQPRRVVTQGRRVNLGAMLDEKLARKILP
jgi:hypothetical protein